MSMKQIHVLHLGTKLEFRGKEVGFHSLAKHRADKNARVTVCSLTKKVPHKKRIDEDGIWVICLEVPAENFR